MSRSLRVRQSGINTVKLAVRRSGFPSQRALSEDVGLSLATVSNFLTGKPVDRATFLELCERLSLDSGAISDLGPEPSAPLNQRALAAIVFTDVVSFTQHMAEQEHHTLTLVQRDFQLIQSLCQQFAGRLLKNLGDGLLLYFNSAEQAVLCAIAIQQTLAETTAQLPPADILYHRIGIDLGDVVHSDDDVMGHSVNLAARLQTEAPPGGICLSQAVYTVVEGHLPIPAAYAGECQLKGLPAPLPIYHITLPSVQNPNLNAQTSTPSPPAAALSSPKLDWGDAMDVSAFYGRTQELATLESWIVHENCRLVTLMGMGGIGKTAVSIKLAEQIQNEFEVVIWRSLRNAPPLKDLLTDLLGVLSCQQGIDLPEALGGQITCLIRYLQQARGLLVLDNAESILDMGDRAGAYRDGYEAYGQLFQSVGESRHQSCLLLTSREMPGGLAAKAGTTLPIRTLRLAGLDAENAQLILVEKGVARQGTDAHDLIEQYSGNPLALKIASTTIQDLFDGNVSSFLTQGTAVFGDISDLLEQQFNRLTEFEQQTMIWLAIAREWVALADLQADMLPPAAPKVLLESLASLQQRCLIEKAAPTLREQESSTLNDNPARFTQQPVVMEYVTNRLIDQVCGELIRGEVSLIESYALSKAQTKDYLRNTQRRLIVAPVLAQLQSHFGRREAVKHCLDQTLVILKARPLQLPGYGAGNLLNLLNQIGANLNGYDFSQLTVWQVYLQGVRLHRVNFTQADLTKSVFTQTLGDILSIAFSPDSTLLATGVDRRILLWHLADRRQIASLEGHHAWVRCVAFSLDGAQLASGSLDHTIRLWNVQTGQCLKTLRGHGGDIQSIAFSPNGQILASGSNDHTIRLWDVRLRHCVKILTGHQNRILRVIFAPDQQTLISTSDDQTIRVWDMATGDCRQIIKTHVNWLLSAALSPDGKTLVTGSDHQTVKFWDAQTGECLGILPDYSAEAWSVAFSPDGQLLATGSDDRTIRLWDVQTRQCLKTWQEHTNQVWQVSFSPDGRTLVSGSEDQAVKLWDTTTGHCLTTITSHRNWVGAIAFSPDDRTLASGSKDGQIRLWDVTTGHCIKTQPGHSDVVMAMAFSAGAEGDRSGGRGAAGAGGILATGSDDHTIKLWNAQTFNCLKTLWGHDGWVHGVAFSPDGLTLVSGSSDNMVKLWEVTSGECLQTLEGHSQRVKAVAFHPQRVIIASGSDDHTVKIWDGGTGECLRTLAGHTDWVLSVAFSPDGKLVASGSGDCTIKIWDLQTGKCLQTLEGHSHRVRSVAFSSAPGVEGSELSGSPSPPTLEDLTSPAPPRIGGPGGLWLASGSEDCTVKLWNPSAGDCLQTLEGHDQVVWTVTFNHKGDSIASCSDDGTIRIWDINTGENLKVLQPERPYEGMNITGAVGLTQAQRSTLCALGAISE